MEIWTSSLEGARSCISLSERGPTGSSTWARRSPSPACASMWVGTRSWHTLLLRSATLTATATWTWRWASRSEHWYIRSTSLRRGPRAVASAMLFQPRGNSPAPRSPTGIEMATPTCSSGTPTARWCSWSGPAMDCFRLRLPALGAWSQQASGPPRARPRWTSTGTVGSTWCLAQPQGYSFTISASRAITPSTQLSGEILSRSRSSTYRPASTLSRPS
mmetsp:Transcript_87839/g.268800  ORF Transcript_87839/g.268800 Transcript_87839/m.268800 type:complete len:218 (-) Transcript_87839:270-923(-)